ETGNAALPTGYSEVVFGELFRAAGWKRDEVVIANKLWWEFWPDESAAQELDGSLGRMGLDYLDLAYAAEPPEGLEVAEVVGSAGELIASGKLRAWGFLNWPPELMVEATEIARREGVPPPCAAQLAYNLVLRSAVENADAILAATGVSVVASMPLWFGVLTGKYAAGGAAGRSLPREPSRGRERRALAARPSTRSRRPRARGRRRRRSSPPRSPRRARPCSARRSRAREPGVPGSQR